MTQDELKALIEDLRLNHEYCPKEVILQAADELEALAQPEQEPVSSDPLPRACNLAGVDYQTFLKIKAYMPVAPPQRTEPVIDKSAAKRIATTLGWTPPRTWVGLTDEALDDVYFCVEGGATPLETWREQARTIEAKLKQKNGYTEEKNT